jgi:hypothetical protein
MAGGNELFLNMAATELYVTLSLHTPFPERQSISRPHQLHETHAMNDQQPTRWRMLPPLSHPRTPLLQTASFDDLEALNRAQVSFDCHSDRGEPAPLALEPLHPPKRHSRPKFLTRASHYFGTTASGKHHSSQHDRVTISFDPEPPKDLDHAHIDQIVDTIFSRITTNLDKPISAPNNEPILRVLEAYRELQVEREGLQEKLNEAVFHCNTTMDTLQGERRHWKEDEANYKAEIKRLEMILAHGKRGLSAVTLARQQSLIRRGNSKRATGINSELANDQDVVHEILSKYQFERPDVGRASQPFSLSPPSSRLSQSFRESYPLLTNVDIGSWRDSLPTASESSRSDLSDDFSSTGGDLLPDETDQLVLTTQAVEHIPTLIARVTGSRK